MANKADASPVCVARRKQSVDAASGSDDQVLDAMDRQTTDIERVEMSRFRLQDVSTRQVDTLLSGCGEHFRALSLEDCVLCERFFAHASQRFAARGLGLASFRAVRCRQLGMTTLIALTGALSPALEELELSSCALARQAGIILSQSLQNCRALRRLVLSDNHLRDGGARAIADGLRALIASRSGGPASVLASSSAPPFAGLELLDVSRNSISSTGLAAFAGVRVRTLLAAKNAIEGVVTTPSRALAVMILDGGELRVLDLRGNCLSAEGVQELVRVAFRERSSLRSLALTGCGLDVGAIEALQRGLLESPGCPLQELSLGERHQGESEDGDRDGNGSMSTALAALKTAVEQTHLKLRVTIATGPEDKPEAGAVTPLQALSESPAPAHESPPSESSWRIASPDTTRPPTLPFTPAESVQPLGMASLMTESGGSDLRLRPADVEFIVSRTVESMNRNFDARIAQLLARMETQQLEKHTSQVQFLLGKVEACERAIPRLEARLEVLSDRVASGGAQLAKLQSDVQTQLLTMRHEFDAKLTASAAPSAAPAPSPSLPPPSPLLTSVMQTQVDELVAIRIRASEHKTLGELQKLRREAAAATAAAAAAAAASSSSYQSPLPSPMSTCSTADSQAAVLEAVSLHLSQFRRELDDQQNGTLRDFTESIVRDGLRLDERMARVEAQVATLEGVVQAEQQASLLALEAISEAFSDATSTPPSPSRAQQEKRRARGSNLQ